MKSIPASLLTDSVTVYPVDESADYGDRWLDPVVYERVRMDFGMGFGSGASAGHSAYDTRWAEDERTNALLFVDAIRSVPATPPALHSKVEVEQDGRTYTGFVKSIRTFKAHGRKTHHWEVLLG